MRKIIDRHLATLIFAVVALGFVGGGIASLASARSVSSVFWMAAAALAAGYSLVSAVLVVLRERRTGVDVVAFLAIVGAVSLKEYFAGSVIAVMVLTGSSIEDWAKGRARRELRGLADRTPRTVTRVTEHGLSEIPLGEVGIGDVIQVAPGAVVPVDGLMISAGVFDESALTGEGLPVSCAPGEKVSSGVVNAGAPAKLKVTISPAESTYASIVRMARSAEASTAPMVRMADRYSLWFLGITGIATGLGWVLGGPARAVAVLVIATPCPLVIAPPVALISGLSRAAKIGVIVKGGAALERLSRCTTLLVDKTGTLTEGRPRLSGIYVAEGCDPDEILRLAGSLDQVSPHVLAHSVVSAAKERALALHAPSQSVETPGEGVRGLVDGYQVAIGQARWMGITEMPGWAQAAVRQAETDGSLSVFVAVDGTPSGVLTFNDRVRLDAARTLRRLREDGMDRIVIVSGDKKEVAEAVGSVLGVDLVLAEQSPADKLHAVKKESALAPTVMVGDGINDAPALALADVGVAMGARGQTASSESADIVLVSDHLERLGQARSLALRARKIAVQSIIGGIGLSVIGMGLASAGLISAVAGALVQEVIDVLAIANGLRAGLPLGKPWNDQIGMKLAQKFSAEHVAVMADIEKMRRIADSISPSSRHSIDSVREMVKILEENVMPHEKAEEDLLYPSLKKYLGGRDPLEAMSRGHTEIVRQIRRVGMLTQRLDVNGIDEREAAELKSSLYGLAAILELNTFQEEETYSSLLDAVSS